MTIGAQESHSSRLVGERTLRIRRLQGFAKHHTVPDASNDATRAFVRKVAHEDVKAATDDLYQNARTLFGYKRREMDYVCENGSSRIETPDFVFQLHGDQCTQSFTEAKLVSEVSELKNVEVCADPRFLTCFSDICDRIVVDFWRPINIEEKIDRIEDIPVLEKALSYSPDGTHFELKLSQLDLLIEVNEVSMTISLLTLRDLSKLLSQSQKALDILASCELGVSLARG